MGVLFRRISVVCVVALAATILTLQPLCSQVKPAKPKRLNVAVLDFEARDGLTKGEAASLSDQFSGELFATGEFTVIDRNRIKAILQEQGFQQSEACNQVECVVDVGRILKVEKMFVGTIGKVGQTFSVTIQMIDITSAEVQMNKKRLYSGQVDELATDIIPEMAAEMASAVTGKDIKPKSAPGSSTWLWYVGGGVAVAGGVAAILLSKKESPPPKAEALPALPALP